ncbi:MAG: Uncharacterized protein FD123_1025 [Bacteroidetes bacterium]|nr:MAG: Uncharacterized protein FD123_1025 [Bacteroidota bacterium]
MGVFFLQLRLKIKSILLRLLYFKNEQVLLRGELKNTPDKIPVIFFTVHKAGSSLLSDRLTKLFSRSGYVTADLSSFFAKTNPAQRKKFFADLRWKEKVFSQRGVYYCVFRYPFDVPFFDKHKIILVLRDPRDILVSHYFSTRFSHPTQNMDFFSLKEKANSMTIDEYVLFIADDFRQRYEKYLGMIGKENVLFLRYEDMITAPVDFEERIRTFLGMPVEKGELVREEDFQLEQENPQAHKRYVQSGDHIRKLKPETIEKLNGIFGKVLVPLGY